MKKFLLLGLALVLLGSALFADDAKVMPARLGRFYLAPSFITASKAFDDEGSREDTDAMKMFNLGMAAEYGILSWMTGAIQWAPGINAWSTIDTDVPYIGGTGLVISDSDVRLLDKGDIFLGAKMQILGGDGLVKNDNLRLAFAPGLKIPLPGPDFEKQVENAVSGDKVTPATMDNHVLAAGLRSYFDFVINDKFFINLYNEALFNVTKKDLKKVGYMEYMLATAIDQANAGMTAMAQPALFDYDKVKYGYELTFELEPVFSTPAGKGILFTAGLPVRYVTKSGKKYDFTYDETYVNTVMGMLGGMGMTDEAAGVGTALYMIKGLEDSEAQSHLLTLTPNAAVFFYGWPLPMEFKLSYTAPLWGQNAGANHVIGFQIRVYFKI